MKHSEFSINDAFWVATLVGPQHWRCTDMGTRVIVAIKLDRDEDPSWYNGPPYAVAEHVFDENDIPVCYRTKEEATY